MTAEDGPRAGEAAGAAWGGGPRGPGPCSPAAPRSGLPGRRPAAPTPLQPSSGPAAAASSRVLCRSQWKANERLLRELFFFSF